MKTILKSKTFWAAIVQFLIAVVAWITGEITLWVLILDLVAVLGVIFYRSSIDQNLRNFFNKFTWFKSKTVWTFATAALGFLLSWLTGAIELAQALMGIAAAFIGIFLQSSQAPEA